MILFYTEKVEPEINGHSVDSGVGGPFNSNCFVLGNVRLSSIGVSERQTTLLQLGLWVIPALGQNELLKIDSFYKYRISPFHLQSREEANSAEL